MGNDGYNDIIRTNGSSENALSLFGAFPYARMQRFPPQVVRVMKGVFVGSAVVLGSDIILGPLFWPFGRWPFPALAAVFFAVSLLALSGILLTGRRYRRVDEFVQTHSYLAAYFVLAP